MRARFSDENLLEYNYFPSLTDIKKFYKLLNKHIFNNQLIQPKLKLARLHGCWGDCSGYEDSKIVIRLSQFHISLPSFLTTLGHEMVHQYQWQIDGGRRIAKGKSPVMSHGPSFHKWRKKFDKFDMPLNEGIYKRDFS